MPFTVAWDLRPQARFRTALSLSVFAAAIVLGMIAITFVASFASPMDAVATPRGHITAGNINDYEVGRPQQFLVGKFWLVRLSQEEVIALYAKDPYLGTSVVWRQNFSYPDPVSGQLRAGWFRNPSHGQTYDLDGRCVGGGPCIRGLDRRPVTLTNDGGITVNVADHRLIKGQPLRP